MKLYSAELSPNALRVRAVIFELGLDAEIVEINPVAGDTRTAAFLELNPNGKVPVLVEDDFVLWESRAINAYLASRKPDSNLYPQALRQRAIVDQWSYWHAVHLGPALTKTVFERVFRKRFGLGDPDEAAIIAGTREVAQLLPILDARLDGREWVADSLSLADFALASTFVFRKPGGISFASVPNVAAWMERMEARESWQKAVAPALAIVGN